MRKKIELVLKILFGVIMLVNMIAFSMGKP